MTEQTKIIQLQDTLNRYLLYFPRSKSTAADVHSFIGEETLSKPYRYTIRFTSADGHERIIHRSGGHAYGRWMSGATAADAGYLSFR